MKISINGEETEIERGTVLDVVRRLGAEAGLGIAVAVNGEVVARSRWSEATLEDGDSVEVLRAIGGG